MKTGVKFIIMIAMVLTSFILLIRLGHMASDWTFWLALIMLPAAGYLAGKTNFQSSE